MEVEPTTVEINDIPDILDIPKELEEQLDQQIERHEIFKNDYIQYLNLLKGQIESDSKTLTPTIWQILSFKYDTLWNALNLLLKYITRKNHEESINEDENKIEEIIKNRIEILSEDPVEKERLENIIKEKDEYIKKERTLFMDELLSEMKICLLYLKFFIYPELPKLLFKDTFILSRLLLKKYKLKEEEDNIDDEIFQHIKELKDYSSYYITKPIKRKTNTKIIIKKGFDENGNIIEKEEKEENMIEQGEGEEENILLLKAMNESINFIKNIKLEEELPMLIYNEINNIHEHITEFDIFTNKDFQTFGLNNEINFYENNSRDLLEILLKYDSNERIYALASYIRPLGIPAKSKMFGIKYFLNINFDEKSTENIIGEQRYEKKEVQKKTVVKKTISESITKLYENYNTIHKDSQYDINELKRIEVEGSVLRDENKIIRSLTLNPRSFESYYNKFKTSNERIKRNIKIVDDTDKPSIYYFPELFIINSGSIIERRDIFDKYIDKIDKSQIIPLKMFNEQIFKTIRVSDEWIDNELGYNYDIFEKEAIWNGFYKNIHIKILNDLYINLHKNKNNEIKLNEKIKNWEIYSVSLILEKYEIDNDILKNTINGWLIGIYENIQKESKYRDFPFTVIRKDIKNVKLNKYDAEKTFKVHSKVKEFAKKRNNKLKELGFENYKDENGKTQWRPIKEINRNELMLYLKELHNINYDIIYLRCLTIMYIIVYSVILNMPGVTDNEKNDFKDTTDYIYGKTVDYDTLIINTINLLNEYISGNVHNTILNENISENENIIMNSGNENISSSPTTKENILGEKNEKPMEIETEISN